MDFIQQDAPGMPDDFRQAAIPAERRERVTLELDADIVRFMQGEGADWKRQVNGLLRFYMDTSRQKADEFAADGFDPGEMVPVPGLS